MVQRSIDFFIPQLRFVSLVENGTQVLFCTLMGAYKTEDISLAKELLPSLGKGMLCLADRNFGGFALSQQAGGTDADLLWRMRANLCLPREKRLPDVSSPSRVYELRKDLRHKKMALSVEL